MLGAHVGVVPVEVGLLGVKRCRYHSPGVPSGFTVRVHVSPWKFEIQLVGISSPFGPCPGGTRSARARAPGPAARPANHGCSLEMWFGTMSMIVRMPSSRASLMSSSASSRCRRSGGCRGSPRRRSRRRRGATGTRVEPERVDAEFPEVPESAAHAAQVARAVAVRVREAADVDLVDHRAAPPQRILHEVGGTVPGSVSGMVTLSFSSVDGRRAASVGDGGVDTPKRNESNRLMQLFNIQHPLAFSFVNLRERFADVLHISRGSPSRELMPRGARVGASGRVSAGRARQCGAGAVDDRTTSSGAKNTSSPLGASLDICRA